MTTLTVKVDGFRRANPIHEGNRISGDQIKNYHPTLLDELGFKKVESEIWVHNSTIPLRHHLYVLFGK